MRIQKFQLGGGTYVPNIANPFSSAAAADQAAAAASGKKSSGDDGLISKAVMKEITKNGIPVDVQNFMNQLADVEEDISRGLGVNKRTLYALQAEANRIIQQKNYLTKAESSAEENQSIGEIAVGSRGELFTIGEDGNIKSISSHNYDIEKDGPALTVGELIEHRKFNPTQAFDSQITAVVRSNIGMPKINKWLLDVIKSVGSSDTTSEAYTDLASYIGQEAAKRPSESELRALQSMYNTLQKLGPDAIFKTSDHQSSKNLEIALNYIQSVLPRDMQTQLTGRYVASGGDLNDAGNYMRSLIAGALSTNNKTVSKQTINFQTPVNKAAGTLAGKTSSSSSKTFYQTPNEAFFDGDLNQTDIILSDNAAYNKYGVKLKGNQMPALTTDNGNAVSNLPMSIAINETIGKYLDKNYIYMGDQMLSGEADLGKVAYGSDQVAQVYMPCTEDGAIDWEGFHRYTDAEEEIRRNNVTDPNQKNQIHMEMGSYVRYNSDGSIMQTDNVQPYLLTYGYTIDDHIDSDNKMVRELSGSEEDSAEALLSAIYNKNAAKRTGYKGLPNKQIWDDIFKVPIFIKVNKFASGDSYRYGGHGSNMMPRGLEEDMIQQKMQEKPAQYITGSSSLLYQEEYE